MSRFETIRGTFLDAHLVSAPGLVGHLAQFWLEEMPSAVEVCFSA